MKNWFNLKGNKWEHDGKINYFTNLDAWKNEKTTTPAQHADRIGSSQIPPEDIPPENDELSDLPF